MRAGKEQLARALEVRIGELILHGFPPIDRHHLAAAFERELVTLLADGRTRAGLGAAGAERLDAGMLVIPRTATAVQLGRRVAGAVYRGLQR